MDKEILQIIEDTKPGKLKYMEKQATKKNFASVYDYLLDAKQNKEKASALINLQAHTKKVEDIIRKYSNNKSLAETDLEAVFKMYGELNPFDIIGSKETIKQTPNITHLRMMIEILFSNGKELFQKSFIKYEHLIKNDVMFWGILPPFWGISNVGIEDEIFHRYGRQNVPLEKRIEAGILLEKIVSPNSTSNTFEHYVEKIKDWKDENIIAPIYRSFKVKAGNSIRKNVVKDNPEAHIHVEGSSWSYSFQKSCASKFLLYNRHLLKKHGELSTDEQADKVISEFYGQDKSVNIYDDVLYDGYYQCIGLFGVEKKNIQFATDFMGEDEVVINPSDIKLIDYRFGNILDVKTAELISSISASYSTSIEQKSGKTISRSSYIGQDGLFDLVRVLVKKVLDENPEQLKKFISNNQTEFGILLKKVIGTLREVCGADLNYKLIETPTGNKVQISIGDVPLDRFNDGIRQRTSIPKKYIHH